MTDNLVDAVARAIAEYDFGVPPGDSFVISAKDIEFNTPYARAAIETVFDALIAEAEEAARFSGENGYRDISEVWQKHGAWIRAKKAEVLGE